MTAIGTRRPREGRCERCEKPLTDLVWETWESIAPWGAPLPPVTDWREQDGTDTHCAGDPFCDAPEIDWRARALAAEAALQDARDVLADQSGGALIAGDGSVAGDVAMRLIDLSTACVNALADAEARGRQSGLFEAWCAVAAERDAEMECYRRSRGKDGGEYWKGVVDTTDEALARIVALAKEATDGP